MRISDGHRTPIELDTLPIIEFDTISIIEFDTISIVEFDTISKIEFDTMPIIEFDVISNASTHTAVTDCPGRDPSASSTGLYFYPIRCHAQLLSYA